MFSVVIGLLVANFSRQFTKKWKKLGMAAAIVLYLLNRKMIVH